jgi:hypothetical protein
MFGDCGVDKRFSESLQLRQRAFLVGTHQAAITGDIRRQDSRQSPLYGLAAQGAPHAPGKLNAYIAELWADVRLCPTPDLGQNAQA